MNIKRSIKTLEGFKKEALNFKTFKKIWPTVRRDFVDVDVQTAFELYKKMQLPSQIQDSLALYDKIFSLTNITPEEEEEDDESNYEDEGWIYDPVTGKRHWGSEGSGIFVTDGYRVVIQARGSGRWGLPGGGVPKHKGTNARMDLFKSAKKEFTEETGLNLPSGSVIGGPITFSEPNAGIPDTKEFRYHTFVYKISTEDMDKIAVDVGTVFEEYKKNHPKRSLHASQRTRVVLKDELLKLDLHYGLQSVIDRLLSHLSDPQVEKDEDIEVVSFSKNKLLKLCEKLYSLGFAKESKRIFDLYLLK